MPAGCGAELTGPTTAESTRHVQPGSLVRVRYAASARSRAPCAGMAGGMGVRSDAGGATVAESRTPWRRSSGARVSRTRRVRPFDAAVAAVSGEPGLCGLSMGTRPQSRAPRRRPGRMPGALERVAKAAPEESQSRWLESRRPVCARTGQALAEGRAPRHHARHAIHRAPQGHQRLATLRARRRPQDRSAGDPRAAAGSAAGADHVHLQPHRWRGRMAVLRREGRAAHREHRGRVQPSRDGTESCRPVRDRGSSRSACRQVAAVRSPAAESAHGSIGTRAAVAGSDALRAERRSDA